MSASEELISARSELRGLFHVAAAVATIGYAPWLWIHAEPTNRNVVALFGLGMLGMFVTSATYHRYPWASEGSRAVARRADHAMIFVGIGSIFVPLHSAACASSITCEGPAMRLTVVAAGLSGTLAIVAAIFGLDRHRRLRVAVYLAFAWSGLVMAGLAMPRVGAVGLMEATTALVIASLGAIVYARRRPNPLPGVLEYHDVFHLATLVALAPIFDLVRRCVALPG